MPSAIYKIVNLVTNKIYVGSADHVVRRFSEHENKLNNGTHKNKYLQASWILHGKSAFEFSILETVDLNVDLIKREQHWINTLDCVAPNGYNLNPIAGSSLGYKHTDEFREKARLNHLGKTHSVETKAKMSASQKGRVMSEESREKIRASKAHKFVNQDRWGTKYNIVNRVWTCPDGQKCSCDKCRTKRSDYVRKHRENKALKS